MLNEVFVLWFVDVGTDDEVLIGIYSSKEHADAAIARLSRQPGFVERPSGFLCEKHTLNEDHWVEGFVRA